MTYKDYCKTKYPILLLHGLNCRDEKPLFYFGRIPETLKKHGSKVYLGRQDAWGTIADNGNILKERIHQILKIENSEKINIIAHSKAGLEARYLVSSLKLDNQIASISTISTPHHGSKTAEKWANHSILLHILALPSNYCWRLLGDKKPNFTSVIRSLTPDAMKQFNTENKDSPNVFYQSWGTSLNESKDDRLMGILRHFCYKLDGENDGLVSPTSTHWGQYNGTIENISHQDIVDCRKKDLQHFSTKKFYIKLVHNLAQKGF